MTITGTGPPLATPFDADGAVDHDRLRELVTWVESRGVDFLVPCGSNSEAPLLTHEERVAVVETVCDAASVPVLAGTGTPGFEPTLDLTERAAEAGADAVLVVTPFYFDHDQSTLADYYRDVADASPLPVYLYSVPQLTDVRLTPETVGRLAGHPNVAGMKDSSGDLDAFSRTLARTRAESFDLLVGAGGVYAAALDAGAAGGILALANVAPDVASEVYRRHRAGDAAAAHALNDAARELIHAVTAVHGVPGLKATMRSRGAPVGYARRPHRPVGDDVVAELDEMVSSSLAALDG